MLCTPLVAVALRIAAWDGLAVMASLSAISGWGDLSKLSLHFGKPSIELISERLPIARGEARRPPMICPAPRIWSMRLRVANRSSSGRAPATRAALPVDTTACEG